MILIRFFVFRELEGVAFGAVSAANSKHESAGLLSPESHDEVNCCNSQVENGNRFSSDLHPSENNDSSSLYHDLRCCPRGLTLV